MVHPLPLQPNVLQLAIGQPRVLIKHTFYLTKKIIKDSCKFVSIYVQYHRLIVLKTNQ
jgi:hypothetical protein